MMKRLLFPALIVLVAAGCGEKKPPSAAAPEVVRGVRLLAVEKTTVPDYVEAVGTVRAAQSSQISSQIVATVTSVRVHDGESVRRGQTLITLDDAQPRATLERATAGVSAAKQDVAASEADYGLAAATLKRYQSLYEKKSVSPHEFDEVQARATAAAAHREQAGAALAAANAMEAQARSGLAFTQIRAPFDGVVTDKRIDPGVLAAPGVPLLSVEDTSCFRVDATVDEGDILLVMLGAPTPVFVDALGQEVSGRVAQIVPSADPQSRTFVVKIELPRNSRLRSGLFARARFPRGQRQVIRVPRTALVERGQLQGVYVVGGERVASLRYVTLGKASGEDVEVLSGLSPGDTLVTQAGDAELAGKKIEAAP